METPPPDPVPHGSGTVDEATLVPVGRDRRFVARLVLLCAVAVLAAAFVGARLQRAAGSCGASLIRPGASVIPPQRGQSMNRTP